MNINTLLPKHINLEELKEKVPTFNGTFQEFVDFAMNHEVTLATNNDGEVVDFYIEADKDPMLDQLIGMSFASSYNMYSKETLMKWFEMVIKAKMAGHTIHVDPCMEQKGECYVNGNLVKFRDENDYNPYNQEDENDWEEDEGDDDELPEEISLTFDDLDELAGYEVDVDEVASWVKKYLRKTYKHCLARGYSLEDSMTISDCDVYLENIEWGRPLSNSELENLGY